MKSYEQTIANILLGTQILAESHFKVGDDVKIKETGAEGEVVKLDDPQVGKYYTVKHEDGSMKKYSSNELELEDEEDEEEMKEEAKQIEELSKDTLQNYTTKAGAVAKNQLHYAMHGDPDDREEGEKAATAYQKRIKGINKARNKMDKMKEESEELDEATAADIQKALSSTPKGLTIHMKHKDSGETKSTTFMGTHSAVAAAKSHINAMKKKGYEFHKHELVETNEDDVDQTIIEHKSFDIELPETLRFGDYLTAAKKLVENDEQALMVANEFFKVQDEALVIESFTRADIDSKVKAHEKAGHQVTMPKYSTKEGKPYAEYTVTDKDSGKKTKYIHHGSTRRVVT